MYIRTQSHQELAVDFTVGSHPPRLLTEKTTLREFAERRNDFGVRLKDGDRFDTWPTLKSIRESEPPIVYRWSTRSKRFFNIA